MQGRLLSSTGAAAAPALVLTRDAAADTRATTFSVAGTGATATA